LPYIHGFTGGFVRNGPVSGSTEGTRVLTGRIETYLDICMRMLTDLFKLMGDISRVRILLLLESKELCVSQIAGVLGMVQPLVSRNLSLLFKAGFLDDRRDGKMTFYRLKKGLPMAHACLMDILRDCPCMSNPIIDADMKALKELTEYQDFNGSRDMGMFTKRMKRRPQSVNN
jgi:ArsR family transcriptional regulator, arsenate/arsenite/antimonite-responsive transcriptional repressor